MKVWPLYWFRLAPNLGEPRRCADDVVGARGRPTELAPLHDLGKVLIMNRRKFLTAAAAAAGVLVEVRCERIEEASTETFDVVTARACAPLAKLLGYAAPFQGPATVNLFLKGQNVAAELTGAHKYWKMLVNRHPSRTDPSGTILEIRELARVR